MTFAAKYKNNNMKRTIIALCALLAFFTADAKERKEWKEIEKPLNFYVANDLGRNGFYDHRKVADLMGEMAEAIDIEFVVATGDVHHFEGVRSVHDPLWMTNFELIYRHPDLMIPWYPVLGNHEYRGSAQAVVDYSGISSRWRMEGLHYTKVFEEDGTTVRIVFIDTTPLIDKYRTDSMKYADTRATDIEQELEWLDSVLASADEDWVIVAGHHPVFADTDKDECERTDMQKRVDGILNKYGNVDMYICGHIHNFQHIRKENSDIDYIVNTSGSLSRKVSPVDGTVFCSPETGFSVVCADKDTLSLHMVNSRGRIIHTVTRTK